ncbi:MAG: FecR domain-containing protein [Pseudomonadota bacterium]
MAERGFEFSDAVRKQALEWRVLIDNDALVGGELQRFEVWLKADPVHVQAFDRAATVLSAFSRLNDSKIEAHYFRLSFFDRAREALASLSWPWLVTGRGMALAGAAAALAISLFLSIQLIGPSSTPSLVPTPIVSMYQTAIGQTETITLSDGSELTLGPGTEIEVSISEAARYVGFVKGAAVFRVVADEARPFKVVSGDFEATVLGTVFDMRSNGGIVRVSVSEGRVGVARPLMINDAPSSLMHRKELSAGQEITSTPVDGLSVIRMFQDETFAVWRDNRLRYNGAPLAELIADANRYSETPIVLEDVDSDIREIRATFTYDGRDVAAMLASLPNLFPVIVDRTDPDTIVIRPEE